jgi:site-specific recombinase XerD
MAAHGDHTYAECAAAAKALDIELPNGLTDLRVHDLRHNFASEGASVGLSLPMIGALLGHSNLATTARYAHLMDDPLRQAAERIGSRLTADEGRESA